MRELKQSLPDEVRARLGVPDDALVDAQLAAPRATSRGLVLADVRTMPVEARDNEDGTRSIVGYATTWDTYYDVAGGPPWGWSECVVRGAANKAIVEHDDVRFLTNHDGVPHARSRGLSVDTMQLVVDDIGLRFEVPGVDVERNVFAAAMLSAIDRGDLDQCSFAFQAVRQEWNDDYTERRILEVRLFDVSAVTYPANTATIIGARKVADPTDERPRLSLALATAQAFALD